MKFRTPALALLLGLLLTGVTRAQITTYPHQSTTLPTNARFEIVQSEVAAKWTFRLDRYTGRVWQLVQTRTNANAWEAMTVLGLPPQVTPAAPRFQIFTSGIAAKYTLLIDNQSGQTWVLAALVNKDGSQGGSIWEPFDLGAL
jgi:hypothetical protein